VSKKPTNKVNKNHGIISRISSQLTQILHALREQGLKSVKTIGLGIHALGQSVPQMHLVLEEQPRSGRSRGGGHIRGLLMVVLMARGSLRRSLLLLGMLTRRLLLPIGLILIRVAIAGARSGRIALVVEHDIIGWGRTLDAAAFPLQLQVEITRWIATSDFMRGSGGQVVQLEACILNKPTRTPTSSRRSATTDCWHGPSCCCS